MYGDLLHWALSHRMAQLTAAGLSASDLMRLRRAAVNYKRGVVPFSDVRFIWDIMPALEQVHITKP